MSSLHHSFPTLYGKDKSDKTKIWKANVFVNHDGTAYSIIEYGQLDGKLQSARRDVGVGKNIGKKNETTPVQQCVSETERKWLDKRDKENYREEKEEEVKSEPEQYLPMLAQTLKKNKLSLPCYVQPKIDGLRCLFYRKGVEIVAQSRTGAFFITVEHIKSELYLEEGVVLDGELYTTEIPFETLAGLLKKKKLSEKDKEALQKVEYHCYDVYLPGDRNLPFEERIKRITEGRLVKRVPTELIDSVEEFERKFSEYTSQGYEGIMVRTPEGKYGLNYRSKDLCKYKEFEEAEYTIKSFTQGDGRDSGTVIWICETEEGKEFSVRPRGTVEQRSEWYQLGKSYIGKKLTVVYQNLSEQGVPRFPVGKAVRDEY
jgi:DNA ligase-1